MTSFWRIFLTSFVIVGAAPIVTLATNDVQTSDDTYPVKDETFPTLLERKSIQAKILPKQGKSLDLKQRNLKNAPELQFLSEANIRDDTNSKNSVDLNRSRPSLRSPASHVEDEENFEVEERQNEQTEAFETHTTQNDNWDHESSSTDFEYCHQQCFSSRNFGGNCPICQGGFCVGGGPGFCGSCNSNLQCTNPACPQCAGFVCQPNRFVCNNIPCTFANQCTNPSCPSCINGFCQRGGFRTCIGNEPALRAALQVGGTHQICAANPITVNLEINTNANNVRLVCDAGTNCKIQAGNGNRLFRVTGNQWTVQGIIFQNGGNGGNVQEGGAFYFTNSVVSATFSNCQFVSNRATQSGGAVFAVNGQVQFNQCTDAGNYAPQCSFARVGGSCRQPFLDDEDYEMEVSFPEA